MFNNLKSKINKDLSSSKNDATQNDELSLTRTQSIESLNSNAASESKSKRKDEIIKKWESKVSNLVVTVRERNAKICELENQITNDKLEYEKKITEIKESCALNVQSLLDEHRVQLQKLEQERDKYQKKLKEVQTQMENIRGTRFSRDEEKESLEDLNKQELAKVKHILLHRENEYDKLQLKTEELKRNFDRLEILNKSITCDLEKKQNDLSRLTKQREMDTEERRSQQTTIRGLLTDKDNMEIKLDECQEKLTKTESLLMNVERSSAELHSKLQQTNRDHEQLKTKYNRLESEKVDRESDLKDRIRSLETHLAMIRETEQVDERVKILEDKYFRLESKNVEEKMLKDNLLKSWSDRVDSLESQISNLNKKISEDSEEIAQYNQVKSNISAAFEKQIGDLRQELADYEKKVSLLKEEIDEKDLILNEERNKWVSLEDKLHSEFQSKVFETTNLSQKNLQIENELKKCNDQLNAIQAELKSKTIIILKHEEDVKKIKTELEEKSDEINSLMNERFKRELKLTELNSKVTSLESDKAELTKSALQIDSDFKSLQIQLKKSTDDKIEMAKKLESLNEQHHNLRNECDQRIRTMTIEVESRCRELEVAHAHIKELKHQNLDLQSEKDTVILSIESSEVLKLKNEMEVLNSQLLDKNKIIRSQKLQISDLKKSLSREIKINSGSQKWMNYDNISLESRNNSNNQLTSSDNHLEINKIHSNIFSSNHETASSSSDDSPVVVDKNGFIIMDQINFKYLKHVVVKFLLSKESEAVQLIKAVSTLLRLTPEEETSIRQTIQARTSWFSSSKSKISSKSVQDRLKKSKQTRSQRL